MSLSGAPWRRPHYIYPISAELSALRIKWGMLPPLKYTRNELFILEGTTDNLLKIVSYAYDYQHDDVLEGDNKDNKPSTSIPFFDFIGYCFCFVGYWTGPFYNYRTYYNMLHSKTLIRSSKLALWHMRWMLILLPIHLAQNALIPLDYVMEPEFVERSFLYKYLYMFAGFWTFKCKFYGGWVMAEGICIACNLGTEEKDDGSVDYSSIVNIDIYNTEIQWELANCVRAWNKSVQRWMKSYVYDTTTLPKSIRTDFVFGISAGWQGVRPGYYLTFFSAPPMMKLQQKVGNLSRSYRAAHPNAEMVYRVVNWWTVRLMSILIFTLPRYILNLLTVLEVGTRMYWVPWIAISVVIILGIALPTGPRPDKRGA
eukprot:sb/3479484/